MIRPCRVVRPVFTWLGRECEIPDICGLFTRTAGGRRHERRPPAVRSEVSDRSPCGGRGGFAQCVHLPSPGGVRHTDRKGRIATRKFLAAIRSHRVGRPGSGANHSKAAYRRMIRDRRRGEWWCDPQHVHRLWTSLVPGGAKCLLYKGNWGHKGHIRSALSQVVEFSVEFARGCPHGSDRCGDCRADVARAASDGPVVVAAHRYSPIRAWTSGCVRRRMRGSDRSTGRTEGPWHALPRTGEGHDRRIRSTASRCPRCRAGHRCGNHLLDKYESPVKSCADTAETPHRPYGIGAYPAYVIAGDSIGAWCLGMLGGV